SVKKTTRNALEYLGTAQPARCFKETCTAVLAVVRCGTWKEEKSWPKAIGKGRDGIRTRARKSPIRILRTTGARVSTARDPHMPRTAADPNGRRARLATTS